MSKDINVEVNENKEAYELAFHLVPSLGDDNVVKVFEEITKTVEKINGNIVSKSEPALLDLEYQMEKVVDSVKSKYNTAYFAWVIFEGGDIQKLDEELKTNSDVLRYLLIKTDQKDSIPATDVAAVLNREVEEPKEEKKEEKKEESKEEVKKEEDKVDEAIDELVK
jgi:ribosomal protein S6